MEIIAFYIIASIITVSAVLMVTSRELVHSIVYMVISFIGVGGLFILLQAEFVAAVQILVYAGGIVVLFLFVVMLELRSRTMSTAAGVCFASMLVAAQVLSGLAMPSGPTKVSIWGVLPLSAASGLVMP